MTCILRRKGLRTASKLIFAVFFLLSIGKQVAAQSENQLYGGGTVLYRLSLKGLPDLVFPSMDPVSGKRYFVTRGCVICHSVNGVGGDHASALDLPRSTRVLDVLGFVTRMWRSEGAMSEMQRKELGEEVYLTSQELGDIIAFLHSHKEQRRFSNDDIPMVILRYIENFERTLGSE